MSELPKSVRPKPIVKGCTVVATSRGWESINSKGHRELLVQFKGLDKLVGEEDLEVASEPVTNGEEITDVQDDKDEGAGLLEDEFKDDLTPSEVVYSRQYLESLHWEQLKEEAAKNEVVGNSRAVLVKGICETLGLE